MRVMSIGAISEEVECRVYDDALLRCADASCILLNWASDGWHQKKDIMNTVYELSDLFLSTTEDNQ